MGESSPIGSPDDGAGVERAAQIVEYSNDVVGSRCRVRDREGGDLAQDLGWCIAERTQGEPGIDGWSREPQAAIRSATQPNRLSWGWSRIHAGRLTAVVCSAPEPAVGPVVGGLVQVDCQVTERRPRKREVGTISASGIR